MSKRVCAEPGCPKVQTESRCPAHARPTAHRRGYNHSHKVLRAAYQRRMDADETFTCWRCFKPLDPRSWDLGHRDDRSGYEGPECLPCNRATARR